MLQSTKTHLLVTNIAKKLPFSVKVVEFSKPILVRREGVSNEDLWSDPAQYQMYLDDKKAGLYKNVVPDLVVPLYNLSLFDSGSSLFSRADHASKALQDAYDAKLVKLPVIDPEQSLMDSIRRTRRVISEYVLCNKFNMFVTFTFSPDKFDRYDVPYLKKQLTQWLNSQQKLHEVNFKYLIVPELHKDGALHFHAMFQDYMLPYTPSIHPQFIKKNGRQFLNPRRGTHIQHNHKKVYNLTNYNLGHNHFTFIQNTQASANYVKKYIVKDIAMLSGKRRYWCSSNLAKPVKVYNSDYVQDPRLQPVFETELYKIGYIDLVDRHEMPVVNLSLIDIPF